MTRTLKIFFTIAMFITAAQAATLASVIESLKKDPIRRCGSGCSKSFMRSTFDYLLFACGSGGCDKDFVIRTNGLGRTAHIQEYCVVSEKFHSPNWSMRIQADLIASGARLVLVAVPYGSRTEVERFTRPFVLSEVIPRNQLGIINQMVKKYCGVTH